MILLADTITVICPLTSRARVELGLALFAVGAKVVSTFQTFIVHYNVNGAEITQQCLHLLQLNVVH